MKKLLFYIFILLADLSATNFESLAKYTLENSLELKKLLLETKIIEKQLELVSSSFYPTIKLEANIQHSKKINDSSTAPSNIWNDSLTQSSFSQSSLSIAFSYDLFRFGGSYYELKSKQAELIARNYEECEEIKKLLLRLLDIYSQARISQLEKKYSEKINNLYIKIYDYSQRLNKSGLLSKTIENNYAKNIADNLVNIQKINENLQKYIEELASISTISKSKFKSLEPLFIEHKMNYVNKFEQTQTYKKLINIITQKEADLKLASTKYFPTISLYGKYDFYGQDKHHFKDSIKDIGRNSYRIGVGFSWILFDGFKTSSLNDVSSLELQIAQLDLKNAKEKFEKDIKVFQNEIDARKKMFLHVSSSKELSLNTSIMSSKLFKSGQLDKINTIQTQIQTLQTDLERLKIQENLNKTYKAQEIKYAKDYICKVH